jgi:uncharacterized protein YfeS
MSYFELKPETAHLKAKQLLTEDFYWSPTEETAPFGSDDGSDAFHGFVEWRKKNKKESPVVYLQELIKEWGYGTFNMTSNDPEMVKEVMMSMEGSQIIAQDNAVIAVGFGQFVLEGKIEKDIQDLTLKAIKRELVIDLINEFQGEYRETRRSQLKKMLSVVGRMNE